MTRSESQRRTAGQLAVVAARVGDTQCMLDAGRPALEMALEILAALADVEVQLEEASRQVASLFADELTEALPADALQIELEQTLALLRRD
jgi:hypothetical protein